MWPNPQTPADMVTFTEEILNEKLHFLCSLNRTPVSDCFDLHHQAFRYGKNSLKSVIFKQECWLVSILSGRKQWKEQISHIFLLFLSLTLNKWMPAGF